MGLKSAQAWGCLSMLRKMSIQRHKVSSHPFPPPSRYFCSQKTVLEIGRQIQMCSANRRDLPHSPPFPFEWGWIALESWLWDRVSYSQIRHRVPYTMFFFEYSLRGEIKATKYHYCFTVCAKMEHWNSTKVPIPANFTNSVISLSLLLSSLYSFDIKKLLKFWS